MGSEPFMRTEQPDRTGTNKVLFDGDGHHLFWWCRWRCCAPTRCTLLLCRRGMCKKQKKVIVRIDFAGEAQDSGWTKSLTRFFTYTRYTCRNGANDLVPFRSIPQGRIESRHAVRWQGGDAEYPLAGLLIKLVLGATHFRWASEDI